MPNPAKAAAERELAGNPGHREIPEPLAVLEGVLGGPPDVPEDLGTVGREAWERVWPVLVRWARPDLDYEVIRRYCQALDQREVLLVDSKKRSRTAWRAGVALAKLEDRLLVMERDLGLTPHGRKSLGIAQEKPKPVRKLDKYLAD